MFAIRRPAARLGLLLQLLLPFLPTACHITNDASQAILAVEADTSLLRHDRVVVILKDGGKAPDTLFSGKLASLDTLSRLPVPGYDGHRVLIVIQGHQGGQLVYEERRDYDGGAERLVAIDVPLDLTKPAAPGAPDIRPDKVRLFSGGASAVLEIHPPEAWQDIPLQWTTGDPAVATVSQAGELTPVGPGVTYVRAASGDGKRDASAVTVVRDPPVIDAGAPDTAVLVGSAVAFRVKVTQEYGAVAVLAWDLDGDGAFEDSAAGAEGQTLFTTAPHAYAEAAQVTARFRARDGEGNVSEASKRIKVTSTVPRISGPSADRVLVNIKDSVAFAGSAASAGGLQAFAWDFDGDGKDDLTGPLAGDSAAVAGGWRYLSPGNYKARLRVTDAAGTAVAGTVDIAVRLDRPVADAGADAAVSPGATVRLRGQALDTLGRIVLREWKIGAGAFAAVGDSGETSFAAPADPQDILCVFRATDDDGLLAEDTVKITVNDAKAPTLSALLPADTVITIKDSVAFSAHADAAENDLKAWSLDFDGDGRADAQGGLAGKAGDIKAGRRYPIEGVFTASLKVEDQAGKVATAQARVTVKYDAPSADAGLDTTVAAGGRVNLHGKARDSLGTIAKLEWKIGAEAFATVSRGDTTFIAPGSAGTVPCLFRVTDDDGLVDADTVFVTVSASADADLSGLALSEGSLAPAFAAGTTSYSASVANTVASLTVTPTAGAGSTLKVNGAASPSGSPSGALALSVGPNTVTVEVTAQDGVTRKTYTVTVTRAAPPSADLSNLTLSAGSLNPTFAAATTSYAASVPNGTASITVTPTAAGAGASLKVNGAAVNSGTASGALALDVGPNTVTVAVTASDGAATRTYTVTVTRAASANADLSAPALSAGTLAPAFAAGTTGYTASVSNATSSLTVTPTAAGAGAVIRVNGTVVASGSASGALGLSVGPNTLTVAVTAQDGTTTKSYTVTVTRGASANADLSALAVASVFLSPTFNPATTSYTATAAGSVNSVTVTPTTAVTGGSVRVNGTVVASGSASQAIPLVTGNTTLAVLVTAPDGTTTKTYTVTVTRGKSTDVTLSNLLPSSGALSPAFSPAIRTYAITVPDGTFQIRFTPVAGNSAQALAVNGDAVTSGQPSQIIDLRYGRNEINIEVYAEERSIDDFYRIVVTRPAPANMYLGYAWVSQGSADGPLSSYIHNSGGGAVNYSRRGTGYYTVTFKGLVGGHHGVTHVTAYGNPGGYCNHRGSSAFDDYSVDLNCFDRNGTAADMSFSTLVLFPRAHSTGGNAFAWANGGSSPDPYQPSVEYSYNSSGQDIVITRQATGRYKVAVKGQATSPEMGVPMVTAYIGGTERCRVESWGLGVSGDHETMVGCTTPAGNPVDVIFNFSLMHPPGGSGFGVGAALITGATANADGSQAFTTGGGAISVTNPSTGQYTLSFAGVGSQGSGRNGNVQVAAYGNTSITCGIGGWSHDTAFNVDILCHDPQGNPVNSAFVPWIFK